MVQANADVNQYVHVIKDDSEKWTWLVSRLNGFQSHGSVLIFVGTKNASEELSLNLNRAGFNSKIFDSIFVILHILTII